jgi:hypothetical protein
MADWKNVPRPRGPHPGKTSKRRPEDAERYGNSYDRIFGRRSCRGCEDLESSPDRQLICVRCHEYIDDVNSPPCRKEP